MMLSSDFLLFISSSQPGVQRSQGICANRNDTAFQAITPPVIITRSTVDLSNNVTALSSFCFLVTARTDPGNTNPIFRLYDNILRERGSMIITQNSVQLRWLGSTVIFNVNFTGNNFRQFQICVENNRASLFEDCTQVGGTQVFDTSAFPSFTSNFQSPASLYLFANLTGEAFNQVYVICMQFHAVMMLEVDIRTFLPPSLLPSLPPSLSFSL